MSFAAESPRWLVSAGRIDEAAQVVEHTLGIPVTPASCPSWRRSQGATRGSSTALFRGVYLRRTVFVAGLCTSATIYIGAVITFVGFLVCLGLAEETSNRSSEDTGGLPALSDDPSKLGRVHARTVLS